MVKISVGGGFCLQGTNPGSMFPFAVVFRKLSCLAVAFGFIFKLILAYQLVKH